MSHSSTFDPFIMKKPFQVFQGKVSSADMTADVKTLCPQWANTAVWHRASRVPYILRVHTQASVNEQPRWVVKLGLPCHASVCSGRRAACTPPGQGSFCSFKCISSDGLNCSNSNCTLKYNLRRTEHTRTQTLWQKVLQAARPQGKCRTQAKG